MIYGVVIKKASPSPASEPKPGGKSDRFVIENGSTLLGYPRRVGSPEPFAWPRNLRDIDAAESKLFISHAHFLLEKRGRIFADSRMFLAPVNVQSGMAYSGAFVKPCVGTYIEWWLRRGEEELAFRVSGSPLSGANVSKSIAKDGSLVPLGRNRVIDLAREFSSAHGRYRSERERFDAYSLWEVIEHLNGEEPRYDCGLLEFMLDKEKNRNEELEHQIAALESRLQSYKDRLKNALALLDK